MRSVDFSAVKTIAAGYDIRVGGGVVLRDLDLESWKRMAGEIANRNFTREEWWRYFPDEPYRRTFPKLLWPSDLLGAERSRQST